MNKRQSLLRRGTVAIQRMWNFGLDFALPWKCVLCDSPDDNAQVSINRTSYCTSCTEKFEAAIADVDQSCERCGAVLGPFVPTDSPCVHCRDKPLKFDSVSCLGMYGETIRDAILSAKYSSSTVGLEALCRLLVQERCQQLRGIKPDLVMPIPHHWRARLTRHFNSAAVIAESLSVAIGAPLEDQTLYRSRLTRLQKRVDLKDRFENQKGAFGLRNPELLKGKRVLIVDDVLTTGATCSEASRLLKSAGAKTCHVAVIARVLDSSA